MVETDNGAEIMALPLPLPPVGQPYKKAWGDVYDFYGNMVDRGDKSRPYKGDIHNDSIDNVYTEWMHHINKFFLKHEGWDTRIPETQVAHVNEIITRLYGGYDFYSFIRMITSDYGYLSDTIRSEYKVWVDNLRSEMFESFYRENQISPSQVPSNSLDAMKQLFNRHAYDGGLLVRDWVGNFKYKVGIETVDGKFYDMTAEKLYEDWMIGYHVKSVAGAISGLKPSLEALSTGKKRPGFLKRLLLKSQIERKKRAIGWTIYPIDKDLNTRVNIFDVVRFYPPTGEPIDNPTRW